MSYVNMVASGSTEETKEDSKVLKFDKYQAEVSAQKVKIHLMKKNRNHLGLEPKPAGGGRARELWHERNDTCVATIWEACEHDADVLEVANQYMEAKALLPDDDPNKEVLSNEMLQTLVDRFRGELGNVLEKTTAEYHSFKIRANEKVAIGIDRLNGIIQKLTKLGQPPTEESKLAKIKKSIHTPELKELWLAIAMLPKATTTYQIVKDACEEFDEAKRQLEEFEIDKQGEQVNMLGPQGGVENVKCSFCMKKGHTASVCRVKHKNKIFQKFKRNGKAKAKNMRKGAQQVGSEAYTGCFHCGSKEHKAAECKRGNKRKIDRKYEKKGSKKVKKSSSVGWSKYVDDDVSSGEETNMIGGEVLLTETGDERVYLDSCAGKQLFIVKDDRVLEKYVEEPGVISLTKKGSAMETQGVGSFQQWHGIKVCNDAVKNIVSGGMLRAMGYGLELLRVPKIVELNTGREVLVGNYDEHGGMPWVALHDVLNLRCISSCHYVMGGGKQ